MKLLRYAVYNFRSVAESGWIEVGDVTSMIGVNESGKTNLLVPLWKLNPAREGELQPTSDYPKKLFGEIRADPGMHCFIEAEFELDSGTAGKIAALTGMSPQQFKSVVVARYYDGEYGLTFPNFNKVEHLDGSEFNNLVVTAATQISGLSALKAEESLKASLISELKEVEKTYPIGSPVSAATLKTIATSIRKHVPEAGPKSGAIGPRAIQLAEDLESRHALLTKPSPEEVDGVLEAIVEAMPKFVYYSNYGNLDSEIYLPHVVQNLKRSDLGTKEAAKARTLRVLFKFVKLEPEEILTLGKEFIDPSNPTRQPTDAEIESTAEKKRERAILLQSAGALLTEKFKDWWKQGDYRFRFDADGNHFRIWVSDDRRPEEIELESRSTGLQWFLSFYLVFLVESAGDHKNAILLLDEPGLSLHPLAQRDLSKFFDGLSTNQIIYTTHSPFLVDADRLDRVRKVFVDDDGTTKASPNLRQSGAKEAHAGAAYAVYSALNLNVAESLLLGCQPVIVEGASDQHYLTMMKVLLIGGGKITPSRELVFPPAGGTKTLRISASILTGRDDRLPVVLLDSDQMGSRMARELKTSLYNDAKELVLETDSYVQFANSELEDLLPTGLFAEAVDRVERLAERTFSDFVKAGQPVVPQVEAWAKEEGIELVEGWKVEVSKRVKQLALSRGLAAIDSKYVDSWVKLFGDFQLRAA